jgi:hypothetical protein
MNAFSFTLTECMMIMTEAARTNRSLKKNHPEYPIYREAWTMGDCKVTYGIAMDKKTTIECWDDHGRRRGSWTIADNLNG